MPPKGGERFILPINNVTCDVPTTKQMERSIPSPTSQASTARILSIANVLAFALNTVKTAGFCPFSSRFSPNQDNASISDEYQTIITPNGIVFFIWAVIFLSEVIFVALTFFSERERCHALVLDGASFWFVAGKLVHYHGSTVEFFSWRMVADSLYLFP